MQNTQRFTQSLLRRLLPREPDHRPGRYMIEGDPQKRWWRCQLTDISVAGVGLEIAEPDPAVAEGQRIVLAIEGHARQLRGEIRHIGDGGASGVRIGVQFVELTEPERKYIQSMRVLDIRC